MKIGFSMTKCYLKLLIAFLFLLLCSKQLIASPQEPDYIIYKNDTIATYNLILEAYLQEKNPEETKLFGLSFRNTLKNDSRSMDCWRGYQAIYEIENDSLFLSYIIECGTIKKINKKKSDKNLHTLFGNQVKNKKVFIDWFSGDISFPQKSEDKQNKVIRWDEIFYRIYELETVISISNGKVLKIENVENYVDDPERINRKNKEQIPDILFEELKNVKWEILDISCFGNYSITIDKNGNVSNVKRLFLPENIECINTIYNALKELKFDIIKDKGKPISEDILIEIWITKEGKIENWTR